jgi:hypothetical protein
MRTGLAIAFGFAAVLVAPAAMAQDTGDGSTTVEPPKVTTQVKTTTTTTPAASTAPKDDGVTDHEKVVGHLGVGYLGLTQIPIGSAGGGGGAGGFSHARATLDAPVIGVRYWMSEKMGIDAGLGFTMFSSSNDTVAPGPGGAVVTTTTDGPAAVGVAVHGGLPLAFAYGKHYKFLLVPELNVGYARRGEKQAGNPTPPDIVRTGLRIDAGARVGTEIQFGFIGIPELALQASVGLNFRYQNWKSSQDAGPPVVPTERSSSDTVTSIGTTVQSDPWALFVNNVSAIYYFP